MTEIIHPNEEIRVSDGAQVDLHFSVAIESGAEIDNTRGRDEPVNLTIGDGNLLPGFEKALFGLRAGDRRTVSLPPEDAFGPWNPDNVQRFSHAQFALVADNPEIGMMVEFEDKGKNTLPGVISAINDDEIEVDFNHPLAGQSVLFKVKIFKVTPAGVTGIKLM